MSLPDTEHYEIVVVKDPEHQNTDCYGVKNKDTEVIEYYDNLLPRTYQALVQTQQKRDEMEDMINGVEPILELVAKDKTEH